MDAAPSPVAITDDPFLSPTGALLSADKERVSDGTLFANSSKKYEKMPPETIGFCWHSLVTFCCYWQKVTRRRQKRKTVDKKYTSGGKTENCH